MDNSILLAEFWGWYLIVFFSLIIINTKRIKQMLDYVKDEKFLLLMSFIAIIIGLINIIIHNIWSSDWRVIITLFGWVALFKGILFFSFPDLAKNEVMKFSTKWLPYILILLFFMGLYLLNKVYNYIIY
ncbi:MAG: hypothetical protein OEL54_05325 [Flavobacteriaceae bacterium]|nr:hypothetical protein [Flavobacteriaceae bacterium]